MGVDHGLVGGVRVERRLHDALCLVHLGTECHHLRLHGVAQVSGLLCQRAVGLGCDDRLQLLQLVDDAVVDCLAAAGELVEALELLQVLGTGRQVAGLHHLDHRLDLAAHAGDVVLVHHFLACLCLLLGVDLQGLEELGVLLGSPGGNGLGRGVQIRQSSLACLDRPFRRVAVSGEDDVLVLGVDLCHGITMAHATLNEAGEVCHARRHDCVADHEWEAAVLGGADSTELEAVATEGERGGAVAVLHVRLNVHGSAAARLLLLLLSLVSEQVATRANALNESLEALTWVQRDDGRRSLLRTKAVIVASARHGATHHLVVPEARRTVRGECSNHQQPKLETRVTTKTFTDVYADPRIAGIPWTSKVLRKPVGQASNGGHVELGTSLVLAWVEEVHAGVGANGPVRVLAAAVDAGEGLLVEEHLQTQLRGFSVHDLHEAHVAVAGHVGSTEDRGHLVLAGCHLVVLHRHGAADLKHLSLDVILISYLPKMTTGCRYPRGRAWTLSSSSCTLPGIAWK